MTILLGNCIYGNKISSCREKDNIIVNLSNTLNNLGIETLFLKSSKDIIWIRDIFIIIDNVCFICNLTQRDTIGNNRQNEYKYLLNYLNSQFLVVFIPKNINIEGGDIIQDGNNIFIGLSKRTNNAAFLYLKKIFTNKNVYQIKHNSLHLDCIFSVINNKTILYVDSQITAFTKPNNYKSIPVDNLINKDNPIPLNFVIIKNNIICSNLINNEKLLQYLESKNYRVIPINVYNLWKEGGGIRCMTQWIRTNRFQKIY